MATRKPSGYSDASSISANDEFVVFPSGATRLARLKLSELLASISQATVFTGNVQSLAGSNSVGVVTGNSLYGQVIRIPASISAAFACDIARRSTGMLQVFPDSGVTLKSGTNTNRIPYNGSGRLVFDGTNWHLSQHGAVAADSISVASGGFPIASWGTSNQYVANNTFFTTTATTRIRQNGVICGARCNMQAADTSLTCVKFKVFRYNGSTYDYVDGTDWLGPVTTGTNTIIFPKPLSCAQGDYFAMAIKNGSSAAVYIKSSGASRYESGDISTTNAFVTTAAFDVDLEALTRPPLLGIVGDSIASGLNTASTWATVEDGTGPSGTITSEIANGLKTLVGSGLEYQNHAKSGSQLNNCLSPLVPNCLLAKPAWLLIHCGVNDIANGRTWGQFSADLDSIKALCLNGEKIFVDEILPWTAGSDGDAATIRTWNTNIATWCGSNGATMISCHDAMAKTRVSTGLLDDLATAYDYDGVHLKQAGVDAMAALWKTGLGL